MITSIVVLSIVSFVMLVWNINLVLKNRNQEERIMQLEDFAVTAIEKLKEKQYDYKRK